MRDDNGGVTTIELLAVVGLIAIIALIAVPIASVARNTGDQALAQTALMQVEHELHQVAAAHGGDLPELPSLVAEVNGNLAGVATVAPGPSRGPTAVSLARTMADLDGSGARPVVVGAAFAGPATCWTFRFTAGTPARWAVDNEDGTGEPAVDCTADAIAPLEVTGRRRAPNSLG